jgi:DNA-binding transcriptional LysR family regulator
VLSNVEVRHLRAVIVLAEELNFTRAAHRMHITQPALSKQIAELEEEHQFQLFTRDKRRVVDVTDAGRIFVEEARSALLHADRAVLLARATQEGGERALMIGYSPYADQSWISAILAIQLPLYPKLRIFPTGQFPIELVRSVLAGEINLGLLMRPPLDSQITAVPFALAAVYVVLPENHPAACKELVVFDDLGKDEWIMFPKRFDPVVHDAIMEVARRKGIVCKRTHEVITPEQAIHLVSEQLGVAIFTKACDVGLRHEGVVVKSFSETSLRLEACLIMRADDDSRLVNEFARSFLRKYAPQRPPPKQMELPLSA